MEASQSSSSAGSTLTTNTHAALKRPHWRVYDIMKCYDMLKFNGYSKNQCYEHFLADYTNPNYGLNDFRGLINLNDTLCDRLGPVATNFYNSKFFDTYRISLDGLTKEDLAALRLTPQIATAIIMFDGNNQERQLEAQSGEPDAPNGFVAEQEFLFFGPCPVSGNYTPLAAKSSEVRYLPPENRLIIMDHRKTTYPTFASEYNRKHFTQAMLKKMLWDSSWETIANGTNIPGVDLNKQLTTNVVEAIRDALSIVVGDNQVKTLSDLMRLGTELARKITTIESKATVRYFFMRNNLDLEAYPHWKQNSTSNQFYSDVEVSAEHTYKPLAEAAVREFFECIGEPLVEPEPTIQG